MVSGAPALRWPSAPGIDTGRAEMAARLREMAHARRPEGRASDWSHGGLPCAGWLSSTSSRTGVSRRLGLGALSRRTRQTSQTPCAGGRPRGEGGKAARKCAAAGEPDDAWRIVRTLFHPRIGPQEGRGRG